MAEPYKSSELSCKFFTGCIPDFYYLGELKDCFQDGEGGLDRVRHDGLTFAAQCDIGRFDSTPERRLAFMFLKMEDNQSALPVLQKILEEDVHLPTEALYDVFGDEDFILELIASDEEIDHAGRLIGQRLQGLGSVVRTSKVTEVYRHWGMIPREGAGKEPVWVINPKPYRAIRAFVHCYPSRKLDSLAARQMFLSRLDAALQDKLDSKSELRGIDLIDRIYANSDNSFILGVLCRCGDYYQLNDLANRIAGVVEKEFRSTKTTYLVGGIPHLTPHGVTLSATIRNERAAVLRGAHELLDGYSAIAMEDFRVVGDCRRFNREDRRRLKDLADRICASLALDDSSKAESFVLFGASGSGKTFFLEQLCSTLDGRVRFREIQLDKCSEEQWTSFLDETTAQQGRVLCLLDEMNKNAELEWPLKKVRPALEANRERPAGSQIVWVLAGSEESEASMRRSIEGRGQNGRDVATRIDVWAGVPPSRLGDRLVVVCSSIMARLKVVRPHDEELEVEKIALLYLMTKSENGVPREMAKSAATAVDRIPKGAAHLRYLDLFTGAQEADKERFESEYPASARLKGVFMRVKNS